MSWEIISTIIGTILGSQAVAEIVRWVKNRRTDSRIEEAHADNRHAQVAGGFNVVSGQHTQAARINGQPFANAVFHGEIGRQQVGVFVAVLLVPGMGVIFIIVIGLFYLV